MDEIEIPAGELTFRGLAAGPEEGELVLLLHGFPQTSRCWRHQIAALADAGYRALAFDQRGYSPGARPDEVEQYATLHLVADVLAVADWVGGHTFHLVGHDWGGAIAWQVAGRYPQRVRTLTVVSTPHPEAFTDVLRSDDADQRQRSSYMQVFRAEGSEDGMLAEDATGLRFIFDASGMPADEAAPYIEAMQEPGALKAALNWYRAADLRLVEGLGTIDMPTLYLWSTLDPALGKEAAEATAACVSGPYRFEVFEGVGHWIPEEDPERVNAVLLEHLRS